MNQILCLHPKIKITVLTHVLCETPKRCIEAIFTPPICSDIFSQNVLLIASQYEHLQNLTLADSSPDGDKRNNVLLGVDFIIHVLIVKLKEVMETSLLPLVFFLFGFEAAVMKVRTVYNNLNSTHVLRLNTENVINRSCFDKEPFELYFNEVFYMENSSKINQIKDNVYSLFKENLNFENSRYKIKLPFKKYKETLPDNFYLSKI